MCRDRFCAENHENVRDRGDADRDRTRLVLLSGTSTDYSQVLDSFKRRWLENSKPTPRVSAIYKVILPEKMLVPFLQCRDDVAKNTSLQGNISELCNQRWLYHGTLKACLLGETEGKSTPCDLPFCSLCRILQESYDVSKSGFNNPFGLGIYSTAVPTFADIYSINLKDPDGKRILLLNRVVAGTPYNTSSTRPSLTEAPKGYDSVHALPGLKTPCEETVVYKNAAISPAYVIVYGSSS